MYDIKLFEKPQSFALNGTIEFVIKEIYEDQFILI